MAFVSINTPRPGFGHALLLPLRAVVRAIEMLREGNRIRREFDQLSHKTDTALAQMGLRRDQIAGDIFRRSALY